MLRQTRVPEAAILCQTYRLGIVGWVHSLSIEQEAHAGRGLALALAEGIHKLLELSRALDLEKDLIVVVGDLDVEVLAGSLLLGLVPGRATVVGHVAVVYQSMV